MSDGTSQATQVAVLTAPGRSAIAVIAVAGPDAVASVGRFFQGASGRSLLEQPLQRIVYGRWHGDAGEDLVVCRREREEVEIHCHGGAASIALIVEHLTSCGCEKIDWQKWVSAISACPLTAETHVALAKASTLRTATILLDQYQGALRQELHGILEEMGADSTHLAAERIRHLLANAELGEHLTKPWRVVLAGLPNVGKSSLINAVVGYQRAIVFDQPGTTRDVVTATTAVEGWPIQLSDTAGLHSAPDELESVGIDKTHRQLQEADLVLWVVDASQLDAGGRPMAVDFAKQQAAQMNIDLDWSRVLVVVNKIDLAADAVTSGGEVVVTCAVNNQGIADLIMRLAEHLVPCPPAQGAAVPFAARQVALLRQALARVEAGLIAEGKAALEKLLFSSD